MSKNNPDTNDQKEEAEFDKLVAERFQKNLPQEKGESSTTFPSTSTSLYETPKDENIMSGRNPKLYLLKLEAQENKKAGDEIISAIFKQDKSLARNLSEALYEVYNNPNITRKDDGKPKLKQKFYALVNSSSNEKFFEESPGLKKDILKVYEDAIDHNTKFKAQKEERLKELRGERESTKKAFEELTLKIGETNRPLASSFIKAFSDVYDEKNVTGEKGRYPKSKTKFDKLLEESKIPNEDKLTAQEIYKQALQCNKNYKLFLRDFEKSETTLPFENRARSEKKELSQNQKKLGSPEENSAEKDKSEARPGIIRRVITAIKTFFTSKSQEKQKYDSNIENPQSFPDNYRAKNQPNVENFPDLISFDEPPKTAETKAPKTAEIKKINGVEIFLDLTSSDEPTKTAETKKINDILDEKIKQNLDGLTESLKATPAKSLEPTQAAKKALPDAPKTSPSSAKSFVPNPAINSKNASTSESPNL